METRLPFLQELSPTSGKSVTEEMDRAFIATMKPVHAAHVSVKSCFSRPASPESLANLVVLLASDMSQDISGTVILIDYAWSTVCNKLEPSMCMRDTCPLAGIA